MGCAAVVSSSYVWQDRSAFIFKVKQSNQKIRAYDPSERRKLLIQRHRVISQEA